MKRFLIEVPDKVFVKRGRRAMGKEEPTSKALVERALAWRHDYNDSEVGFEEEEVRVTELSSLPVTLIDRLDTFVDEGSEREAPPEIIVVWKGP